MQNGPLLILINAAGNCLRPEFRKPAQGRMAPRASVRHWRGDASMSMSNHHAHPFSDNPGAQLALLTAAVLILAAIGWFYFH